MLAALNPSPSDSSSGETGPTVPAASSVTADSSGAQWGGSSVAASTPSHLALNRLLLPPFREADGQQPEASPGPALESATPATSRFITVLGLAAHASPPGAWARDDSSASTPSHDSLDALQPRTPGNLREAQPPMPTGPASPVPPLRSRSSRLQLDISNPSSSSPPPSSALVRDAEPASVSQAGGPDGSMGSPSASLFSLPGQPAASADATLPLQPPTPDRPDVSYKGLQSPSRDGEAGLRPHSARLAVAARGGDVVEAGSAGSMPDVVHATAPSSSCTCSAAAGAGCTCNGPARPAQSSGMRSRPQSGSRTAFQAQSGSRRAEDGLSFSAGSPGQQQQGPIRLGDLAAMGASLVEDPGLVIQHHSQRGVNCIRFDTAAVAPEPPLACLEEEGECPGRLLQEPYRVRVCY